MLTSKTLKSNSNSGKRITVAYIGIQLQDSNIKCIWVGKRNTRDMLFNPHGDSFWNPLYGSHLTEQALRVLVYFSAKVIDEETIKEEDVRNTLSKLDPNSLMDIDDMAGKLNELAEEKKPKDQALSSTSQKIIDAAKSGIGSIQKPNESEAKEPANSSDDYLRALGREENVFKLVDDL